jgi:hypothetical protein
MMMNVWHGQNLTQASTDASAVMRSEIAPRSFAD